MRSQMYLKGTCVVQMKSTHILIMSLFKNKDMEIVTTILLIVSWSKTKQKIKFLK